MFLNKIILEKKKEIEYLNTLKQNGVFPNEYKGERIPFKNSLKHITDKAAIIAEFKKSSPSSPEGIDLHASPLDVGISYKNAGVCAISVLTEQRYFKGNMSDLETIANFDLPVLRKDFLIDKIQIEYTACFNASSLLLIARLFESVSSLTDMISIAKLYSIDAVVEIFNERDLDMARDAKADIIQVNNRDLDTLIIDMNTSKRLSKYIDKNELWIVASGIENTHQILELKSYGFDSFLIGSSIMSSKDKNKLLNDFVNCLG